MISYVRRKGRPRLLSLLALTQLLACGDGSSDAEAGPTSLQLGTGEVRFEAVSAGQHLPLHAGTQGGHHVWLSMRAEGLTPESVLLTLDVVPESPAPPAHTEVELDFQPVAGEPGVFEFVGWPARVLSAECAVNKSVKLAVRLEDERGRTAEGNMEIIADPPQTGFPFPCEQP